MTKRPAKEKLCPECGHEFQGSGWDGIDAHWRSKHSRVMTYEEAWPLIQSGTYKRQDTAPMSMKPKRPICDASLAIEAIQRDREEK